MQKGCLLEVVFREKKVVFTYSGGEEDPTTWLY